MFLFACKVGIFYLSLFEIYVLFIFASSNFFDKRENLDNLPFEAWTISNTQTKNIEILNSIFLLFKVYISIMDQIEGFDRRLCHFSSEVLENVPLFYALFYLLLRKLTP